MPNLVSKCGLDCGACPWGPYPRKGMTAESFEQYRNDVKKILGYLPIKTPCVTCLTPDAKIPKESKLPNRKCLIRQCVDKAGVKNCAYCTRFPCDALKATAGAWNRESIEEKLGMPLSEEDYRAFVEPFEGIRRLMAVRASLKPGDLLEPAKTSKIASKTVAFPENLPFSEAEIASFRAVHKLLTALTHSPLGLQNTDAFAQQHKLENLRAHVLRFLWILGSCGKLEEPPARLMVDAKTYSANRGNEKTLAIWSFVEDTVFTVLSLFGVSCERLTLEGAREENLVTGTGYLRYEGWAMSMSFEEKVGGKPALEALQTYAQKIERKYGAKAFRHFQEADMSALFET